MDREAPGRSRYLAIGTKDATPFARPCAANGLAGFKPTWGRVGRSGVFELAATLDHVGSMARSARDCALLLSAIAMMISLSSAFAAPIGNSMRAATCDKLPAAPGIARKPGCRIPVSPENAASVLRHFSTVSRKRTRLPAGNARSWPASSVCHVLADTIDHRATTFCCQLNLRRSGPYRRRA